MARRPHDLIEQVEMVFRTRDPGYRMRESPMEFSSGGETRIVHRGRAGVGPFEAAR